jgi:hypothetical protein
MYIFIVFLSLPKISPGFSETNQEDTLSSVYGTLLNGNGGNGGSGNGDDWGNGGPPADAEYITAIIGELIVFNCHVEFPEGYPVPYIVQWDKKVSPISQLFPAAGGFTYLRTFSRLPQYFCSLHLYFHHSWYVLLQHWSYIFVLTLCAIYGLFDKLYLL